MRRNTKFEPHTLKMEVAPPFAISDKLFDKWQKALKGTSIEDVTPHGNFCYGNTIGALWLRVEIDQRYGLTEDKAKDIIINIFKTLKD